MLEIRRSECPGVWIRLSRHKWTESWSGVGGSVVPLGGNLCGRGLAGLVGEAVWGSSVGACGGKS